jgi:hypothetical protein
VAGRWRDASDADHEADQAGTFEPYVELEYAWSSSAATARLRRGRLTAYCCRRAAGAHLDSSREVGHSVAGEQ